MATCKTSSPNELLVVSGMGYAAPKVITGGRVLLCCPCAQLAQYLSLNIMTLNIATIDVLSAEGVAISVEGVCQIKIQGDPNHAEDRALAIQHFMGKSPTQITDQIRTTLEGHQRAIMGTMTVEKIYGDRTEFANRVFEIAKVDLKNIGLVIVSYTLTDIRDSNGYLEALGVKRTSEVKKDARIGSATARAQAVEVSSECSNVTQNKVFSCEKEIAAGERDFELNKIELETKVQTMKADAELEYNLRLAEVNQKLAAEEGTVAVVERQKLIDLKIEEVKRVEKELKGNTYLPADATKNVLQEQASASKQTITLQSEGKAEVTNVMADADASAINARGTADANQMKLKADALQQYGKAAVAEMVFQTLPKVAAEVAQPFCQMDKMTMVSSNENEIGASQVTTEIIDIVAQMPQMVHRISGLDMSAILKDSLGGK